MFLLTSSVRAAPGWRSATATFSRIKASWGGGGNPKERFMTSIWISRLQSCEQKTRKGPEGLALCKECTETVVAKKVDVPKLNFLESADPRHWAGQVARRLSSARLRQVITRQVPTLGNWRKPSSWLGPWPLPATTSSPPLPPWAPRWLWWGGECSGSASTATTGLTSSKWWARASLDNPAWDTCAVI